MYSLSDFFYAHSYMQLQEIELYYNNGIFTWSSLCIKSIFMIDPIEFYFMDMAQYH